MQTKTRSQRYVRELEINHRYDLDEFTPEWLDGHVNYNNYEEFEEFHGAVHRGHTIDIDRTLSYLGAALELKADYSDGVAKPLPETKAVHAVIDALQKRFPAWFGKPEALSDLDLPCSKYHLVGSELNEMYFAGEIFVNTTPVQGTWTDHLRVTVPMLALVLEEVERQMDADRTTQIECAQREIKCAVIAAAAKYDLDDERLAESLDECKSLWADR